MNNWKNMAGHTRIWVYQSDRLLNDQEVNFIKESSISFINEWTSHGSKMDAAVEVFDNLFLVVFADETQTKTSGCGIDTSVHFVQALSNKLQNDFFDRLKVAFRIDNRIELIQSSEIQEKIKSGVLNPNTLVYNNLIQSKSELDSNWLIPLSESWVAQTI